MNNNHLTIENAQLIFRNFSGEEREYNPAGTRNFCLVIPDDELAKKMATEGWNIRYLKPREEEDKPVPFTQVKVNFNGRKKPKIVQITSHGKTQLNEKTVGQLDAAEIINADVIVNPYEWNANGKTGIKGYLNALYVTIEEDEFEKKYYTPDESITDEDDPF